MHRLTVCEECVSFARGKTGKLRGGVSLEEPGNTDSTEQAPKGGRHFATKHQVELPTPEQVSNERQAIARRRAWGKAVRSTVATLVVVAALAVLIATIFLPVLQISGSSMEPTLHDGDIVVLVKNNSYDRGDLCSFAYENKYLIKRIIGLPGDYIEIDSAGNVYVNGDKLDEPYVSDLALGECDLTFPYQVPDGKYFVMGDHRSTSIDSRSSVIGCVDADQIVGHVFLRVLPLDSISLIG